MNKSKEAETQVEFLRDYVFSIEGKPCTKKKGETGSYAEKTAKILVRNKACKLKENKVKADK